MQELKEYSINWEGLKPGLHAFEYKVDSLFWNSFESSQEYGGVLAVNLTLERKENMLILDFQIVGTLTTGCDRCLAPLDFSYHSDHKMFIKIGDSFVEESEDVIVIPRSQSQINVAQFIYEYICTSVPHKLVHTDEEDCDKDMIEKINSLNAKTENIDPRWEKLMEIQD